MNSQNKNNTNDYTPSLEFYNSLIASFLELKKRFADENTINFFDTVMI